MRSTPTHRSDDTGAGARTVPACTHSALRATGVSPTCSRGKTPERTPVRCTRSVAHDDAFTTLSPSELDVLRAAAHGLTTSESARRLGKGTETVKSQRRQIILKLGARNIANAVALATSSGILTVDPCELERAA